MRAVVFQGIGDVRLDEVPEPRIEQPTDAVITVTATAICGTDLHFVRGTFSGVTPGRILGHEAVGVVEEVGDGVRNLSPGDRVVVGSTVACGWCAYCRAGYFSQCDNANPNGSATAFFGGPEEAGGLDGLQAERARIPFANVGAVRIPSSVTDDQAILVSDIFPSGWFGARLADVKPGKTVAVFGCGPVGQFAIVSAFAQGAGRVFAVDTVPDRLEMARAQGAEVIDFSREDPVQAIRELTGGIGTDRAIDAVGVDARRPEHGPAAPDSSTAEQFDRERDEIAPQARPQGDLWVPGNAPSQALQWAVEALAKAGTLGVIGVYPPAATRFPIGMAMNKNLTIRMGNCPHRRYIPELLRMIGSGAVNPLRILTRREPLTPVIEAYKSFDRRLPGWVKVELIPGAELRGRGTAGVEAGGPATG